MEDELILFETAKIAKEKGFDLNVNEGFTKDGKNFMCGKKSEFFPEECRRPTQSLLQKWLREIHNIHITIFSKSQESWMCRITYKGQSLKDGIYAEDFENYEKALEYALKESLKITIKK
jgi:hypothetical protein